METLEVKPGLALASLTSAPLCPLSICVRTHTHTEAHTPHMHMYTHRHTHTRRMYTQKKHTHTGTYPTHAHVHRHIHTTDACLHTHTHTPSLGLLQFLTSSQSCLQPCPGLPVASPLPSCALPLLPGFSSRGPLEPREAPHWLWPVLFLSYASCWGSSADGPAPSHCLLLSPKRVKNEEKTLNS